MNNGDGRTEAQNLDALFPGLTRKLAARPRLLDGSVRAVEAPKPVDMAHLGDGRFLALMAPGQFQQISWVPGRLFGAYWADPRRMFWTPILAGAAVHLWELSPELLPPSLAAPAGLLALTTPGPGPMGNMERMAVAELALASAPILRDRLGEERALTELGLSRAMSLADRVEALKGWLLETERPAPWVAVHLPAALAVGAGQLDRLLLASGPYRELGEAFAAMAERQGVRTWEEAVLGTISYWRDPRGSAALEALLRPAPAPAPQHRDETRPLFRAAASDMSRSLLKKLATRLGRAKREVEETRTLADARLARVSTMERELADVRRGRDRAVERLRKVEAENAELRAALAAATEREPGPMPAHSEPAVPGFYRARLPGTGQGGLEPSGPGLYRAPTAPPPPEAVLSGRLVYLYTGLERAAARDAMAGALEHYGATCEAFDGNRFGLLGPERFPADALVIIETSHLCHSASELIEARARASGAWFYVGATGSGALARRVAQRWWKTHGGR